MRIVHVTDCFLPMLGGIEVQVSRLAAKQAEAGHEVIVLTCADGDPQEDRKLPYRVLRSVWLGNPMGLPFDPRAPRRFEQIIDACRPDVVHLQLGELTPGVQGLLWRLRDGRVPVVVTVHSVWASFPTMPLYTQLAKLLRKSPVVWTGVSQLVADRIGRVVGRQNVRVLLNGLDDSDWKVKPVPHDGLVVASASRFAPRKRMPELLQMLAAVHESVPEGSLQAVLAGAGPGLEQAKRFVAEKGLEGVITLPGRLSGEKLRELYARSDVFVSPSIHEAASIAGAEAQAAGLVILCRSQSGLGERISAREGAVADTDQQMIDILQSWALDPSLVVPLKKHNYSTICPMDWSIVLPKIEAIYAWAAQRIGADSGRGR